MQIDAEECFGEAKRVFDVEIAELKSLEGRLSSTFVDAVTIIKQSVDAGGKVIGVGVGKSHNICHKITATLTSTGTPAICLNTMNAVHGDLGIIRDGDVVLALSYSGETTEIISLLPHLLRFQIKLIAMTGGLQSTLAKHADVTLDTSVKQEACPLELAPTSSCTAMLVLGDALAIALMKAHGFSRENFARFHPGGQLGRHLLVTARAMMRPLQQTVFAESGTEVGKILDQLIQCKAGAAIIVSGGTLLGIFTHGDFARAFRHAGSAVASLPVDGFITMHPVCVYGDQIATEVLHVLKERRIDELIVLEPGTDHPIGIIDSQDLVRFKLV